MNIRLRKIQKVIAVCWLFIFDWFQVRPIRWSLFGPKAHPWRPLLVRPATLGDVHKLRVTSHRSKYLLRTAKQTSSLIRVSTVLPSPAKRSLTERVMETKPTEISSSKMFGGYNKRYKHFSPTLGCSMTFHIYFPPSPPSPSHKFPVSPLPARSRWSTVFFLRLMMMICYSRRCNWWFHRSCDLSRCFTGYLDWRAPTRTS